MASPFDSLTIPQIQQAITAATPGDAAPNAKFFAGDHWQEGCGWVGPQPAPGDTNAAQVMCEIRRAFVSKNAIREVVRRHVSGVVGHEPAWGLTVRRPLQTDEQPTADEQALIDEAEAALTTWWDERGLKKIVGEVVRHALLGGRSSIRLFVPPGLLVDGRVPQGDLAASLGKIYAQAVCGTAAIVLTHTATQQRCGVYLYTERNQTYAELCYVDMERGETMLRIVGGETATETRLPLDGQLLMHELRCDLLITDQVRDNQKQLNLARTMQGRNVVQGGFLERIVLNGQLPGSWVDDARSPGGKRFVADPHLKVGAGTTNFISGVPIRDQNGAITGYTDPSVVYRDPVSVATFEATAQDAYRAILEETQQLHALIAGDATASGESRKQARADFEDSLLPTKSDVDTLIRNVLAAVLALAAVFAGQRGRYAGLRPTCDCRLNTGPLSGDEQREIVNQYDTGLISRETAMARIGIEDVDAEAARIAAEQDTSAAPTTTAADIAPAPTTGALALLQGGSTSGQ